MKNRKQSRLWLQKLLLSRLIVIMLLLLQLALIVFMLFRYQHLQILELILTAISIGTSLHLLTRDDRKAAFKLSLIFLILLFPLFGGTLYWIFHFETASVGFRRRLVKIEQRTKPDFHPDPAVLNVAEAFAPDNGNQLRYLQNSAGFPVYAHTDTAYYHNGQLLQAAMLEEFEKAEHYIFLEYFIIEEGEFWDSLLDVLRRRVAAGVDVRVIYDDFGCFLKLPTDYARVLRSYGIRCEIFNRFRPFLSVIQNNRDHRKIAVVDGKVAFTGGINLADEYLNRKELYGHWKDSAIRFSGDAAWSFTVMFLRMWSLLSKCEEEPEAYRFPQAESPETNGFVQPYSDSPMQKEHVAEQIFLHMIYSARKKLYLTTPYLMVDDGMILALKLAAKSGVDVRIITPNHPDKKTVHFTSRSYYRDLIGAGVRIFEYNDGFIHSKLLLTDDEYAVVGTTNFDFRSLYQHFECGACLYDTEAIKPICIDFENTLSRCREITEKDCHASLFVRLLQSICRLFAPVM